MRKFARKKHFSKWLSGCASSAVMAWALLTTAGSAAYAAPDACTQTGETVVCEGNQSDGIRYTSGVTDLTVQNIVADIEPENDVGIYLFNNDKGISLNVDTGAYAVRTAGTDNDGIYARSHTGPVSVLFSGNIVTTGDNSEGIVVLSPNGNMVIDSAGKIETGGGGADGILAISDTIGNSTITHSGTIFTDGQGANGINNFVRSGTLTISNTGEIMTAGSEAKGIYGEVVTGNVFIENSGVVSTSGLGGYGIQSSSQLGNINFIHTGSITTTGDYAHGGIFGLSNGDADFDIQGDITVSGSEASALYVADYNGALNLDISGTLSTAGQGGHAVRIETIGSSLDLLTGFESSITTTGQYSDAIKLDFSNYDPSTPAEIELNGFIQTTGENAEGLNAQVFNASAHSVLGGDINTQGLHAYGAVVQVYSGNAAFELNGTATIVTRGAESVGLYQQNFGEYTNSVMLGSSAAITTSGTEAHGIVLSSESEVNVANAGAVRVYGTNASALYILDANNTVINNSGALQGGYGDGWGFYSNSEGSTDFTNSGLIASSSANAMRFGDGDDTVSSTGTISGNVDMGGGINIFVNEETGLLDFGSTFRMYSDTVVGGEYVRMVATATEGSGVSSFTNAGTAYVYFNGVVGETEFYGDYVQTANGQLVFDVDVGGQQIDHMRVYGNAALDGSIYLNFFNVPTSTSDLPSAPGEPIALLSADSLTSSEGLGLDPGELTINDTVAYTFDLWADDTTLWLDILEAIYSFEDMLDGFETDYQKRFAAYLDRQQDAGADNLSPLFDALRMMPDSTALQASFDEFSPFSVLAQQRFMTETVRSELARVPDCVTTKVGGLCLSGGVSFGEYEGDIESFGREYATDSTNLHLVVGLKLSENWDLGARVTLGDDDYDLPGDAKGDQKRLSATVGLKGDMSAGLAMAVTASAGGSDAEFSRASLLSSTSPLVSQQDTSFYGASVRVSKTFDANGFEITPDVGASWVCVNGGGYSEEGTSADALNVDAWDSCQRAIGPGLSFKTPQFGLGQFDTRFGARVGIEALENDDLTVAARLKQAPLTSDRFYTGFEGDGSTRTSAEVGVSGLSANGWQFSAGAEFTDTDLQSGWTLGFRIGKSL